MFLRDKNLAHFTHEQNGGAGGGRENRTLMAEEMPHPVTPPPAVAVDWSVPKVGVFTKCRNWLVAEIPPRLCLMCLSQGVSCK